MKITWNASAAIPSDVQASNVARVHALGLPKVDGLGAWREHPLAIIGAGPSVADHVDLLRDWPGERWAINGAAVWCVEHGIGATFLCIDSAKWDVSILRPFNSPGNKAMIASSCDLSLINALSACCIEVFDLREHGGIAHGTSTATAALVLAPMLGHRKAVLFGCESSFDADRTHVNEREQISLDNAIVVRCGTDDFLTRTQLAIQAEELSSVLREFPDVYSEMSGGLLRAVARHGEYEVVAVSDSVRKTLVPMPTPDELPAVQL